MNSLWCITGGFEVGCNVGLASESVDSAKLYLLRAWLRICRRKQSEN